MIQERICNSAIQFSAVTAIRTHLSWLDKLVTMSIQDIDTMTKEEAQKVCDKFDDTVLFDTEVAMLKCLDLIEDVDVLSGWNSEGFDITTW